TGLKYNPIALFKDDLSLIVDLADDAMSGKIAGKIVRLSYNLTDKKRNQVGCYEYYSLDGNYNQGGIALPYKLVQATGCVY
ncbi:MAG TPA: hypothetical protein PKC14_02435, partial [Candidatus Absconditabacterales bacterium]|nr:hypothetical protein [Candidatus Absconditabacterales bacterium]